MLVTYPCLPDYPQVMDIKYSWILWQGKNFRQFRLLTLNSFIGQFVYPVGGDGMVKRGVTLF